MKYKRLVSVLFLFPGVSEAADDNFEKHPEALRALQNAKIDVCHIPPGNPGKFKTIRISEKAWPAHQNHGDILGKCEDFCRELCIGTDVAEPLVPNEDPVDCFQRCGGGFGIIASGYNEELSITACSADSVVVEGTRAGDLVPGSYLVTTGSADLCDACAPLFRRVTAVEAGSTADSKVLTTVFATFTEIYDESLYDSSVADQEIEPIFNCPHSGGRKLSQEEGYRSLQVSSCSVWESKNSDGRCTYTDCFVGKDGDARDCFSCKDAPCDNGCGAASGPSISGDFGLFDFGEACCIHDYCYSSYFSKAVCDDQFYLKMLDACPFQNQLVKFLLLPISPLAFAASGSCEVAALLFYGLVKGFGDSAYSSAKTDQKAYELTEDCVAECPSTQRSGGQGTTRLVIDLKKTSGTFPVFYQMYSIPDELTIVYEGNTIFSTGGLVSGSQNRDVSFSGSGTLIEVTINAPRPGTAWDVDIGCPYP